MVSSGINLALSSTGSLTFNVAQGTTPSGTDLLVSGPIAGYAGNGIIKSGAGQMTLAGANTFTGPITLNSGGLNINNNTALGTGTFTIAGGTIDSTAGSVSLPNNPRELERRFHLPGQQQHEPRHGTGFPGDRRRYDPHVDGRGRHPDRRRQHLQRHKKRPTA